MIPPFGAYPFSDPQDASLPAAPEGPVILGDDIDPNTGELLSLDGVHPVDAHVRWQFQVRENSAPSLGRAGNRFHEIETLDAKTPNAIRLETQRIYRLLGPDWVRLQPPDNDTPPVRVETSPETQTAALVVDYYNVLQGRSAQVRRAGLR